MINITTTQQNLGRAGFAPGPIDGNWGRATATALLAHQAQRQPDAILRALGQAMATELPRHGILDTPVRLCEFLGETGNESGGYTRFEENLHYSAKRIMEVWPTRFRQLADAAPYAWDPTDADREDIALANIVYNGRMGNRVGTNDGWDDRGGGLLQHTGAAEYAALLKRLGISSEQVHTDPVAMVRAACDYWDREAINALCDAGNLRGARVAINGGVIGLAEVAARRARSLGVVK